MAAYYNENDPKAAAWLRELIKQGAIADGEVDERSVEDVTPAELAGYTQCHFFAGIGGWSYALRLAGWPDDRPVWTGSCPCQPFSAAGTQRGFADERHIWPSWFWLIGQCRPSLVFGEQVANALPWLDLVQSDMEAEEFAFWAAIIGAHSVGAPHVRQRIYWVAESKSQQHDRRGNAWRRRRQLANSGDMGDASGSRGRRDSGTVLGEEGRAQGEMRSFADQSLASIDAGGMEYASSDRWQQWRAESGRWSSVGGCEFLPCTDGKARPVEPGTFPLAHGVSGRVGLLRGYGNAIVPADGAAFIGAYLDAA